MQNLLCDLEALLATDPSLVDDGKLIKNAVIDRAHRLDGNFLKLLLSSDAIRGHFFVEVDGTLVFDKVKFQEFVANKAFLPDNYTAFRNRIGLTDGRGRFLKDSDEVVLAWPYKDCALEGGMTKEDQKRDEIFWNVTLAPDDVTRLFEPKAFAQFELWDAEALGMGRPKAVDELQAHGNLLIIGNNLLALHSLRVKYAEQVELIYIDPPYNTDRDEFRYNDRFTQSSWLTFMRNRLEAAKNLLAQSGVLVLQISDHRLAEIKLVLDEVFGRENFINQISVKTRSPSGFKTVNLGVFEAAEYLLIYARDKRRVVYNKEYQATGYDSNYKFVIDDPSKPPREWQIADIKNVVVAEMGQERAATFISEFGEEAVDGLVAQFALDNADRVFRPTTINDDAAAELRHLREKSRKEPGRIFTFVGTNEQVYVQDGQQLAFYSKKVREIDGVRTPTTLLTNIWQDIPWEGIAAEGGVKLKQGKKPERLIRRLLRMYTKPDALVMDFFAGSGTTAAVAHKMGRRYIGVEQIDYGGNSALERLKRVIGGEQSGVSRLEKWRGGGSFIYCELAEWNEALGKRVRDAADGAALNAVVADIRKNGYWRYSVDQKLFDWEAFRKLPLDKRKQILLDSLDANHLYVNYGDIADPAYEIGDEDIRFNREFYGDLV